MYTEYVLMADGKDAALGEIVRARLLGYLRHEAALIRVYLHEGQLVVRCHEDTVLDPEVERGMARLGQEHGWRAENF